MEGNLMMPYFKLMSHLTGSYTGIECACFMQPNSSTPRLLDSSTPRLLDQLAQSIAKNETRKRSRQEECSLFFRTSTEGNSWSSQYIDL
jgi:hypothetical protein